MPERRIIMSFKVKRLESEMHCVDVVIYEQGEYRKPLALIPEFEAVGLAYELFKCLSDENKRYVFDTIKEKMESSDD